MQIYLPFPLLTKEGKPEAKAYGSLSQRLIEEIFQQNAYSTMKLLIS